MTKPIACAWLTAAALLGGCATSGAVLEPARERAFDFQRDTFAFLNEVEYQYHIDVASRTTVAIGRNPDAEYSQRCFAMTRTARQFMQFARFEPGAPRLGEEEYRDRLRRVLAHDPSERGQAERIVFPGYASLRAFSADREAMVKKEVGGRWLSYYWQRGHWRIMFPFSDGGQATMAENLLAEIRVQRPPVVHLITFPELTINHAVLLYGAEEKGDQIRFSAYDPNDNKRPTTLIFDRRTRRFEYPRQFYFAGGPVDVYEVYKSFAY
ncbi:MAG TPA: hypothetical protein VM074_06210 [Solimonas sp.]|nr:hypothetical protein [Solimonas sp.]